MALADGDNVKFVRLTQAQYDALGTIDPGTLYFVTDSNNVNILYLDGQIFINSQVAASDSTLGIIKTNPTQGITLDANNALSVSGRLGQTATGGLYAPITISPSQVGKGSMLVTEASNTMLGTKSLSVTTGMGLTVQSAAAGSTQYRMTNTYANRILATLALGGVACRNENDAANTVPIVSITVDGTTVQPSSTNSTSPIIITTATSVNPNNAVTQIRVYPPNDGFSNLFGGIAGARPDYGSGAGYSIAVGQQVFNGGNAAAVFGNTQFNTGNSSLLAGRQHINTQMDAFLAGIGHDTSNAARYISAVGRWSDLSSDILFAVGDGTSNTARSNAFEVRDQAIVLRSANGTKYKITVSDTGELITAAL